MAQRNTFSNVTTVAQLEDWYDQMVSPENIAHDGERTYAQIQTGYRKIKADYLVRLAQLTK